MKNRGERPEALVCVGQSGINALATIRSLGRRGIRVHALSLRGSSQVASRSRYCASRIVADAATLYRALRAFAARQKTPALLFVDNDALMRALEPHAAELSQCFRLVERIEQAGALTDKRAQHRLVSELGIAAPATWFPRTHGELAAIGERGQRLIAKPAPRTWCTAAPAEFKALVAESGVELSRLLREYAVDPADVIVQEYVEGGDSEVYVALCYRDRHGLSSVFTARKLRQSPLGAGVMSVGQACDVPSLGEMTVRLADALALRGVLSAEFKRERKTGEYRFIEWNPRPAAFQSIGWACGFDLAWLAYCDHAGIETAGPAIRYDRAGRWINAQCELENLSKAPRLVLQADTWRAYRGRIQWATFAADDPAPWWQSTKQMADEVASALGRRLVQLRPQRAMQSAFRAMTQSETLAFFPPDAHDLRHQVIEAYNSGNLCVGAFDGAELAAWVWVPRAYFERVFPTGGAMDRATFASLGEVFGRIPSPAMA